MSGYISHAILDISIRLSKTNAHLDGSVYIDESTGKHTRCDVSFFSS